MAAVRHPQFFKISYLVTWLSSSTKCGVVYQISSKSDDFSLRYGDFTIFKMADRAPPSILWVQQQVLWKAHVGYDFLQVVNGNHSSKIAVFEKTAFCTYFCRVMLASSAALDASCSVCPCVCPSSSYILSKRINISSNFFHCRVAKPF